MDVASDTAPVSGNRRNPAARLRRMQRAELLGSHTHQAANGIHVHVWIRDGKYLARGYYEKKRFGETLGSYPNEAASRLRRLLNEIEDGSFVRPSEARRQPIKTKIPPKIDLRTLCSRFVAEKRKLRGKKTAQTYLSRLLPALRFAETPDGRRRWPLARDIDADRNFAIDLRAYLFQCQVTRNGHPGAKPRPMSARQVLNVMTTLRTALEWAHRPDVNLLPFTFVNPLTPDIVGGRPRKDPNRPIPIPMERRTELVPQMDLWQLCQLGIFFVLPMRPDEDTGLLISDVDFTSQVLKFETRLQGRDFNKTGQTFRVPFPAELIPLLRVCIGDRTEGPLLRDRATFGGREPARTFIDRAELEAAYAQEVLKAGGEIQNEQDAKALFRRFLQSAGGVSDDQLSKAFRRLVAGKEWAQKVRFYDLRGSVTSEMKKAHVDFLDRKYVTGHALDDIMFDYECLDPHGEMSKYFAYIRPLLEAIKNRTAELIGPDGSADIDDDGSGAYNANRFASGSANPPAVIPIGAWLVHNGCTPMERRAAG